MKYELVPFLSKETIEKEAVALIKKYAYARNWDVKPPIPIEDIIEKHLKLQLDFKDLSEVDALGFIHADGSVVIDHKLDPEEDPSQEGRYRFTLAHEVGHWTLHQRLLNWETMQPSLSFHNTSGKPAIICRETDIDSKPKKVPPEEWQANTFAAYLLMPSKLILAARNDLESNLSPEALCEALAEHFAVSNSAMHIRLEALSLLREGTHPQQPLAF